MAAPPPSDAMAPPPSDGMAPPAPPPPPPLFDSERRLELPLSLRPTFSKTLPSISTSASIQFFSWLAW
jgi:hypothetical protein